MTFDLGVIGKLVEISRRGTEELSLEWRIPKFWSLVPTESDDFYSSPDIRMGNEHFWLRLWPNWKGGETQDSALRWLRLGLRRGDRGPPKTFHFTVGIKGSGGVENSREGETEFSGGCYRAWNNFCLRSKLRECKNRLVPRGTLTITCVLKRPVTAGGNGVSSRGMEFTESGEVSILTKKFEGINLNSKCSDASTRTDTNLEAEGQQPSGQCIVCYEKPVDSVLYRCGHMCMCYDCALKLKKSKSVQCPVCRVSIQDVIKVYRLEVP